MCFNAQQVASWASLPENSALNFPGLRMAQKLLQSSRVGNISQVTHLLRASQGWMNQPLKAVDTDGRTALHWASLSGHMEIVKALVSQGADPSALDNCGRTALHLAATRGHVDVVELLLAANCDIHAVDDFGHTALERATTKGHTQISNMILENSN
jgi:ankyrin repeat protein